MNAQSVLKCLLLLTLALGCDSRADSTTTTKPAAAEDGVAVFFAPEADCGQLIIEQIHQAKKRVLVQAYSFTSDRIARALVDAHKRGVDVQVVLDAEKADKKSETGFLARRGISTYIDSKHEKAHNKIILIDSQTIITGSFNLAATDDESRADNLLIITNKPTLMAAYEANFKQHLDHSRKYD